MKFKTLTAFFVIAVLAAAAPAFGAKKPTPTPKPDTHVMSDEPFGRPPIPSIPTAGEVRVVIEKWLSLHPNRGGKNRLVEVLPGSHYRITAVRFPEVDAVKWSNDPSQWSQIRIAWDKDGVDDEKWLLKNGAIWKREVLDVNGKVIKTEYLK